MQVKLKEIWLLFLILSHMALSPNFGLGAFLDQIFTRGIFWHGLAHLYKKNRHQDSEVIDQDKSDQSTTANWNHQTPK